MTAAPVVLVALVVPVVQERAHRVLLEAPAAPVAQAVRLVSGALRVAAVRAVRPVPLAVVVRVAPVV